MKTIKVIAITFILSFCLTLFNSCRKYPEGPTLSLITKKARLCRVWEMEKYILNDIDQTSYLNLIANNYQLEIKKDNSYISTANNMITEQGTWQFKENKEQYKTTITSTGEETDYVILRLTNTEYWIKNTSNNQTIERHLKAK